MQKSLLIFFVVVCWPMLAVTQNILDKPISISIQRQRLDDVLEIISNKGGFTFSYNSNAINRDSLISINANNKTIRQVLDMIWKSGYEYKQSGNYIIIRKVVPVIENKPPPEKYYTITGYIIDNETGQKVSDASIYEKQQLAATLSGQDGFFTLRLKAKYSRPAITVSKEFYLDTTISIPSKQSQQISVIVRGALLAPPVAIVEVLLPPETIVSQLMLPDTVEQPILISADDTLKVEKKWLGAIMVSSKQKIQSLNLRKFFTERPFQVSFTPGISSHGKMSGQVINHLSVNVLGGYTGGLNGVELGGMFNISKRNVRFVQAAGLFNQVGGYVRGFQAAGISNSVLDSVYGLQSAGISNFVKGCFNGFQASGVSNIVYGNVNGLQTAGISNFSKSYVIGMQAAGVYNHAGKVKGMQVAGIANYAGGNSKGVQLASLGNVASSISGVQFSSIFNYAKHLKGLQVGLINVADSSDGYSLGLFNFVKKGYHKIAMGSNETVTLNINFKGGNKRLYSILSVGANTDEKQQLYAFGIGIGSELKAWRRITFNVDVLPQYLYTGSWKNTNVLISIKPYLQFRLTKWLAIYGGPSFSVYYSNQTSPIDKYQFNIPANSVYKFNISKQVDGWIGWQAGISLF